MMKKLLIAIVVVVAGLATVPLWGSCDLNAQVCNSWCSVRHFNEELKEAGCKARCATDRVSCLARSGAESVDDFVEGFKKQ